MTNQSTIDLTQLEILDVVTSTKGVKSAPLAYSGKQPVYWRPSMMEIVFEPGTYSGEDSFRVTLVARPDAEAQAQMAALDTWIVDTVAANSERLFGKHITIGEVHNWYNPCVKNPERYEPTMKFKMNLGGRSQVRFWDSDKNLRDLPETWRGLKVTLLVRVKSLYFMNKSFGCVLEVTDVMCNQEVPEASASCPFA